MDGISTIINYKIEFLLLLLMSFFVVAVVINVYVV